MTRRHKRTRVLWNQKIGLDADKYIMEFDDRARIVIIRGDNIDLDFIIDTVFQPAITPYGTANPTHVLQSYTVVVAIMGKYLLIDRQFGYIAEVAKEEDW